jgi:hypothetical protein
VHLSKVNGVPRKMALRHAIDDGRDAQTPFYFGNCCEMSDKTFIFTHGTQNDANIRDMYDVIIIMQAMSSERSEAEGLSHQSMPMENKKLNM